jgi:ElaB/YqjD/DUF883 family membrane-anchored ribosome-binding protein
MTTETPVRTSNAKISEALELLNEAAKEKKGELKDLVANRYTHIREVMASTMEHAQEAVAQGKEKVIAIAGDVDERVHKDPWIYIAGTAAASLLLGYLLGSKRK